MSFHYDEDYHRTIAAAGEIAAATRWERQRKMILRYKQSGSILDIGCSSGAFLRTMKGAEWNLFGIEMEPSTAEKARVSTGAEIFVGDVADAPYSAGCFDVITCFDVLEHVYEPRQFLTNVLKWLKPGGIVYTVLPNIDSWESQLFRTFWYGLELPRHLFHFSPHSLRYTMRSLGFREIFLTTRGSYVERSVGYLYSEMIETLGFSPVPSSIPRQPYLAWRAVRKLMRVTFVLPFAHAASIARAGASMEALFTK